MGADDSYVVWNFFYDKLCVRTVIRVIGTYM